MSAPVFFDIVQEANRIGRSIPEIARQSDSVRDLQEQAEQARFALQKRDCRVVARR